MNFIHILDDLSITIDVNNFITPVKITFALPKINEKKPNHDP
jgi:hypothetical protein